VWFARLFGDDALATPLRDALSTLYAGTEVAGIVSQRVYLPEGIHPHAR
jgi:hypothetical protein